MTSDRGGSAYGKPIGKELHARSCLSGLRLQVFVDVEEYMPTSESAGARITVHDQDEQPFPDTHGYSAPTGTVSSFGIQLVGVIFLQAIDTYQKHLSSKALSLNQV